MLRILSKKDFTGSTPLFTFPELTDEFNEFQNLGIWREGLWLEYWENQIINFKFHVYSGIVTIYSGWFISQYSESEITTFWKETIHFSDLLEWIKNDVDLKVISHTPREDPSLTKIWKYDYECYIYGLPDASREDPIFKNHTEFLVQNTKIIRSLPYDWGTGLKLYGPDLDDIDEKIYWFNLVFSKLCYMNK